MNRLSATRLLALLFGGLACSAAYAQALEDDHLVPFDKSELEEHGWSADYRKLYEAKLFMTPGDVARYVHLPGAIAEPEAAVAVYRQPEKQGGLPGGYWVTATQPLHRLSSSIPTGEEEITGRRPIDPKTIGVRRWDAPLPEQTALAIKKVWLAMLSQTRGEHNGNKMLLEGSTEMFSATNSDGKVLRGQLPIEPGENTLALVRLGNSLIDYCSGAVSGRSKLAREIEREALNLFNRVSKRTKANLGGRGQIREGNKGQI